LTFLQTAKYARKLNNAVRRARLDAFDCQLQDAQGLQLQHSPAAQPCNSRTLVLKVAPELAGSWKLVVKVNFRFLFFLFVFRLSSPQLRQDELWSVENYKVSSLLTHYSRPNVEREEKAYEIQEIHVYT
jgi:hypothetical protein